MQRQLVEFLDWGKISYKEAWEKQTVLHEEVKAIKQSNRKNGTAIVQKHFLIFCEHFPVYTLGKSGKIDHLLMNNEQLKQQGIEFFKINRGGDITFHGPGQIVAYPIFDLEEMFTDVHKYVRLLEQVVIDVLKTYKIDSERIKEFTGVWLPANEHMNKRKICAIGVHLSRWVTMHGLAFNVNTNLDFFRNIIPCGIEDLDKEVTSMELELAREIDYEQVKKQLKGSFENNFNIELYES